MNNLTIRNELFIFKQTLARQSTVYEDVMGEIVLIVIVLYTFVSPRIY